MEDFNNEPSQNIFETNKGLLLTFKLRMQLRQSSTIGKPLVILCIILVIAVALLALNTLLIWTKGSNENPYLLYNNKTVIFSIISSLIAIYFFARALREGYKSWRLLEKTDDENALLEGTERLSKMFRWLAIWGIFYVLTLVNEAI